jgi:2-methylaconitate isomerase
VITSPSKRPDCDVDYLFGAVAIGEPLIDWSGNCGNLTATVGPFAIAEGLVPSKPGSTRVRIWQANVGERIDAVVPTDHTGVVETGDFHESGVPFPSAEIRLEFLSSEGGTPFLPTGRAREALVVPGLGPLEVTMTSAGSPTVFCPAKALGLTGREYPQDLDPANPEASHMMRLLEAVRGAAAVAMGLAASPEGATRERPATPKVAWVAPPAEYRASSGVQVRRTAKRGFW